MQDKALANYRSAVTNQLTQLAESVKIYLKCVVRSILHSPLYPTLSHEVVHAAFVPPYFTSSTSCCCFFGCFSGFFFPPAGKRGTTDYAQSVQCIHTYLVSQTSSRGGTDFQLMRTKRSVNLHHVLRILPRLFQRWRQLRSEDYTPSGPHGTCLMFPEHDQRYWLPVLVVPLALGV